MSSPFSSQSHEKRDASARPTRVYIHQLQPTTNSDKLSDRFYCASKRFLMDATRINNAVCRMVKKSVRPHNKILQEAPEEECQFLSASVLGGMPTRSDPLAPHHDGHDVIQLQG